MSTIKVPDNIRALAVKLSNNMNEVDAAGGDVKFNDAAVAAVLPDDISEGDVSKVVTFLSNLSSGMELALGEASVPKIDKDNADTWSTNAKLSIGGATVSANFKARASVPQGVRDGQAVPPKIVSGVTRSSVKLHADASSGFDDVRSHLHSLADAFFG